MILLFWSCVGLVGFTYAGYPLCMLLLARIAPRPVVGRAGAPLPMVSVVVPVHDGEAIVATKLRNLLALDYPGERVEVLVACDGCSDGTADAARGIDDARVRVLEFTPRRGKASCLNDAVAAATGEVLLMVDVRQRIESGALRALVAHLADPAVGAVGGQLRFEDPDTGFAASVDAYWRYESSIRLAEAASGSVVGVSGALYAMRRALFRPLPAETVLDDVLVPMQVAAQGARVTWQPAAVAWDRASDSSAGERVRKVRTLAGNLQLVQLAPWLLDPRRNPLWFRFVGHKLLRLAAPWALLAMGAAALVLARGHVFYLACAIAAAIGVVLVALAPRMPMLAAIFPVRMLVAFVHMNLFAAQAAFAFARGRRLHLW
ncbi:glycosyltransferase family 2 protein [Luteimonas sp. A501]